MRALFPLLLSLLVSGCCVSQATTDHIDTQAAAHDGACRLIELAVSGAAPLSSGVGPASATPADPADAVTQDQLDRTPASVRRLLARTVSFVYESRASWHTLKYTMGDGPDPATLTLSASPAVITSFR
jgi:hypothetical protein